MSIASIIMLACLAFVIYVMIGTVCAHVLAWIHDGHYEEFTCVAAVFWPIGIPFVILLTLGMFLGNMLSAAPGDISGRTKRRRLERIEIAKRYQAELERDAAENAREGAFR